MSSPDPATRLANLEAAVAHQQNDYDSLNAVVTEQANQIDKLLRQVRRMAERLDMLESAARDATPRTLEDDKPPHY